MSRGLPLVGNRLVYTRKRGNLYLLLSTSRGFSHRPIHVGRQRRSPRLYMQWLYSNVPLKKTHPNTLYHISTGIYHCTILDMNMKFCENSCLPRISVDKRFLIMFAISTSLCQITRFLLRRLAIAKLVTIFNIYNMLLKICY